MEEEEKKEPDLEKNSIIDNKYIIIKKIGEGGFSKVYLVQDIHNKEKYAAKIILDSIPPHEKDNISNEVNILNLLKEKPSIDKYATRLYHSGNGEIRKFNNKEMIYSNKFYLISNYLSKGNLDQYVQKTEEGFREKHAKIIFSKILECYKFIHESNICHLDIKLENILLDDHYNPIITDFGLSKEMKKNGENKYEPFVGISMGTPHYMCPQMWKNKKFYGIKADIFSLGVLLLFLITKKSCFNIAYGKDSKYRLICINKHEDYWNKIILIYPQISKLSKELKELYFKMIAYTEDERPNIIKDIFDDPWLKNNKFTNEDYQEYEAMMKDLENKINEDNETMEDKNQEKEEENNIQGSGFRSTKEEGEIFFNFDLRPKYLYKSGLNATNYIKIKGEINPAQFMNSLANKINGKFDCDISRNSKKLKFVVALPNKTKEELENQEEEIEDNEEIENDVLQNFEFKDCIIKIKLFEFIDGGYELHFIKRQGDFTDYYEYFNDIKKIIKEILNYKKDN